MLLIIERRREKRMNRVNRLFLLSVLLVVLLSVNVLAVQPFGASLTPGTSVRAPEDLAGNVSNAIAGNVTELTVTGFSITQSWQGYFGNVTGVITLNDNSDNVMYNWSVASPQGEIYASTNNSILWGYIQCFNLTATGTYASDVNNNGSTSQFGTNMTILENEFGIIYDDNDGLNETFNYNGTQPQGESLIHNLFYTDNLLFTPGECVATHLFDNTNSSADNNFQEVLLYEPSTHSVVFTTLLNEDVRGFDHNQHDFQMLVLENGHGTNTATSTYYFWVELE
jgi:hypothetical protein